jgi:superfamily II DNA or RNA helicase
MRTKIKLENDIEIKTSLNIENQIIKQYTFANPKYQQAINFCRSTKNIDRNICLIKRSYDSLIAPIGVLKFLLSNFNPSIYDIRKIVPTQIPFTGKLRDYQEQFIDEAIRAEGGVMVAATGSGKTVSAIAMAARLKQRTLVLVKSKDLAQQWIDAIKQFTGLEAGLIGNGKHIEGEQFTIGLVQTLVKKDLSLLDYGLVIADECHNAPANQCYQVIINLNSQYKYGLSATPQRRDNLEFMIFAALGNISSQIKQEELGDKVLPVHISTVQIPFNTQVDSWGEFLNALINDQSRNQVIVDYAIKSSKRMGTIVLCSQVRHCEILADILNQSGTDSLVLHGQLPNKIRAERMANAPEAQLIVGTLSLLSEGIDLPHLKALIFASPVSASIDKDNPAATRLIQSIGRCRRPYGKHHHAFVLDIVDQCGFGVSAFKKRKTIYRMQHFDQAA